MSKRPNELDLDFLTKAGREAAREAAETARRAGIPVAGFDPPTVSEGTLSDVDWNNAFHVKILGTVELASKPALSKGTQSRKVMG